MERSTASAFASYTILIAAICFSSMSVRAWEVDGHEWEDAGSDDAAVDSDHDGFEPDRCSQAEAQDLLFDFIVDLKLQGTLSATQACILSYWAGKARFFSW